VIEVVAVVLLVVAVVVVLSVVVMLLVVVAVVVVHLKVCAPNHSINQPNQNKPTNRQTNPKQQRTVGDGTQQSTNHTKPTKPKYTKPHNRQSEMDALARNMEGIAGRMSVVNSFLAGKRAKVRWWVVVAGCAFVCLCVCVCVCIYIDYIYCMCGWVRWWVVVVGCAFVYMVGLFVFFF
jgi:hypothetical protein